MEVAVVGVPGLEAWAGLASTAAAAAVHPDLLFSLAGPQHTAARVALGQKQALQQQVQPPVAVVAVRVTWAPQLQGLVVNLDCGGLCNESTRR